MCATASPYLPDQLSAPLIQSHHVCLFLNWPKHGICCSYLPNIQYLQGMHFPSWSYHSPSCWTSQVRAAAWLLLAFELLDHLSPLLLKPWLQISRQKLKRSHLPGVACHRAAALCHLRCDQTLQIPSAFSEQMSMCLSCQIAQLPLPCLLCWRLQIKLVQLREMELHCWWAETNWHAWALWWLSYGGTKWKSSA